MIRPRVLRYLQGALVDRWLVVDIFRDHAISGKNGREQRPAFDRMLQGVARKDFDLIAAWSVDRLGRSLQHLSPF